MTSNFGSEYFPAHAVFNQQMDHISAVGVLNMYTQFVHHLSKTHLKDLGRFYLVGYAIKQARRKVRPSFGSKTTQNKNTKITKQGMSYKIPRLVRLQPRHIFANGNIKKERGSRRVP